MTQPTPPTPPPPASPPIPAPVPAEPPSPAPGTPQAPEPPAPGPTSPADPDSPEGRLQRAEAALADERRARREAERSLAQVRQEHMTDAERALAQARDEGRTEARRAAGAALAAAEFRVAAAGRLDADAALDALDLSRFVNDDGEVDKAKIAELVAKLVAALPGDRTGGKIPAGPHGAPQDGDFLRAVLRK